MEKNGLLMFEVSAENGLRKSLTMQCIVLHFREGAKAGKTLKQGRG